MRKAVKALLAFAAVMLVVFYALRAAGVRWLE